MKYVVCKECKGYYVLQEGEFFDELGNCRCGGDLEYIETHKKRHSQKTNVKSKEDKIIKGGYLLCNQCHGYYLLQKGESPDDFANCRCGGELEHIEKHGEILEKFSPVKTKDPHEDYHYLNQEGLSLYHAENYSKALNLFDQALKIHPYFPEALNNKGNTLIQILKNKKSMDRIKGYKKALSCYNKALEIEPKNLEILNNKGLALAYLGDYENSYQVFEEALKMSPHDLGTKIKRKNVSEIIINDFTDKGYEKLKNGNYNEAIKYFNKVLEIKPDNISALMYKGGALFATHNYEDAIKCFDVVIYIKGDHSIAWFSKGEAFERLKDYEEAVKCFEKVMDITSKRRGNLPTENISPILNMDLLADAREHIEKIR